MSERTIEGKTFDEWVAELSEITALKTAVDITRLKFGLGGDTPLVDVTEPGANTSGQGSIDSQGE